FGGTSHVVERWQYLAKRVRPSGHRIDWRRRYQSDRSECRMGRNWGSEQSAELLLGRRRLQVDRWWNELEADGPERVTSHRPHRDQPAGSQHSERGAASPSAGAEPGAQPLDDDALRAGV